jgi:hypothetical protein
VWRIKPRPDRTITVPVLLISAAIHGLEVGADAMLDRDWDCYSHEERVEMERYVEATFARVARALEALRAVKAPKPT